MTYTEKLKDPRWQRKRLEILQRDDFACQSCGDKSSTLHVHHRYYVSGRMPWEYPDYCYQTLCKYHHDEIGQELEDKRASGDSFFHGWELAFDYFGNTIEDAYRQEIDAMCKAASEAGAVIDK